MKERIRRLLSLCLVILLLMKGLACLLPMLSSTLKDTLLTELLVEPEQEKQKKGNSKVVETELLEDFFEKAHFVHGDLFSFIASAKRIADTQHSLQLVYFDIPTPPPQV